MKSKLGLIRVLSATVFFIVTCVHVHAQGTQKARLQTHELQWVLNIPDDSWTTEIQSLARLFEDEKYAEADALADDWLKRDFNGALLSLPALRDFVYYYKIHSVSAIFADHLSKHYSGSEQLESLAALDLGNAAVRNVAYDVFNKWWRKDQEGMTRWIQQTPGFFEQSVLEGIVRSILIDKENHAALASAFFSLSPLDGRRVTYFSETIEHWCDEDFEAAIAFIDSLYESGDIQDDTALYRASATIGYRHTNNKNYADALRAISRIKNASIRDWSVRDYSSNIVNNAEKNIFLEWIKSNPIEIDEAAQQINEHFNTIDTGASEKPNK